MLFGHQTNDTTNQTNQVPDNVVNETVAVVPPNPFAADPATGIGLPATSDDNSNATTDNTVSAPITPQPSDQVLNGEVGQDELIVPEPQELSGTDATAFEAPVSEPPVQGSSDDLLALKQQALGELTPLVDHLDQSPEEKFRTTMMMIQSTDNQALLKEAYAAAQTITDDKIRAQALLDIINEINYFTQNK
jgi:hypothetical protein